MMPLRGIVFLSFIQHIYRESGMEERHLEVLDFVLYEVVWKRLKFVFTSQCVYFSFEKEGVVSLRP